MIIDLKNSNVTVWISKLPPILSKALSTLKKETVIGTLSFDPGVMDNLQFSLSKELLSLGLPSQFEINLSSIDKNLYVLKTDPHLRIEGTVTKDFTISPVINAEYLAYKKKHKVSSELPVCETISLREANTTDKIIGVADIDFLSKKRKKMLSDKKRGRLDKGEVMNMIFSAYEELDCWTVKDMSMKINQPTNYTQEIMNEICVLNKKDHRNLWVLKPEYKTKTP